MILSWMIPDFPANRNTDRSFNSTHYSPLWISGRLEVPNAYSWNMEEPHPLGGPGNNEEWQVRGRGGACCAMCALMLLSFSFLLGCAYCPSLFPVCETLSASSRFFCEDRSTGSCFFCEGKMGKSKACVYHLANITPCCGVGVAVVNRQSIKTDKVIPVG